MLKPLRDDPKPVGATLDHHRRTKWQRRRMLLQAFGLALLAIATPSLLSGALQKGRFENLRIVSTVTLEGEPGLFWFFVFTFALFAVGMALGAVFLWRTAKTLR